MSECGKPAIAVYVWPSMEQLPVCEEHAAKARGVAAAMGFRLGSLPAALDSTTCMQQVRDSPPDSAAPTQPTAGAKEQG